MRRNGAAVAGLAAMVLGACADGTGPVAGTATPALDRSAGPEAFDRYVALGTSISMGWASNGVYAGTQQTSWPAQLARLAAHDMTLPLIDEPGCTSPLVAPLALAQRRSGEPLSGSTVCAPNSAGVTLPTSNLGIAGILAHEALQVTPESQSTTRPWFGRVLPPGTTAVAAALGQAPTLVTVEYGGNEVLQGTRGLVAPGVTVVPVSVYTAAMTAMLNAVQSTGAKVLVMGMPTTAGNLPSLRRASEIWQAAPAFASLNVTVGADCESSPNWVNVSTKGLAALITGQVYQEMGLPFSATLDCTDRPGTLDDVLTPADMQALEAMLAAMNGFLEQQAAARGFAYSTIGALYDQPKSPYNPQAQLRSPQPYGHLYSLDAVHPSPAGHTVLAQAAAVALNATYGMDIPVNASTVVASVGR